MTANISTERGRPPGFAGGINGSISSNCSPVRLLVYALLMALTVLFAFQLQLIRVSFFTSVRASQTTSERSIVSGVLWRALSEHHTGRSGVGDRDCSGHLSPLFLVGVHLRLKLLDAL